MQRHSYRSRINYQSRQMLIDELGEWLGRLDGIQKGEILMRSHEESIA
jgi:hypothetical protein